MIKLSFSTLGCPSWELKEIFAAARDLKFDGVEIRGVKNCIFAPNIPEFLDDKIEKTKEILKNNSLVIPLLSSGAVFSAEDFLVQENEAKAYIDLAKKLEVPFVRVLSDLSPEPRKELNIDLIAERMKKICDYAADNNISVLTETNGFFAKSSNLASLMEKTDRKNFGVIWDIHHPYRFYNEPIEQTFKTLEKYIKHVHIKDSKIVDGKVNYQLMGYGDVPFKQAVELLKNNNFDGFVSLEWVKRWTANLTDADIVFPQFAFKMHFLLNP